MACILVSLLKKVIYVKKRIQAIGEITIHSTAVQDHAKLLIQQRPGNFGSVFLGKNGLFPPILSQQWWHWVVLMSDCFIQVGHCSGSREERKQAWFDHPYIPWIHQHYTVSVRGSVILRRDCNWLLEADNSPLVFLLISLFFPAPNAITMLGHDHYFLGWVSSKLFFLFCNVPWCWWMELKLDCVVVVLQLLWAAS